jgi:hypothetical protein
MKLRDASSDSILKTIPHREKNTSKHESCVETPWWRPVLVKPIGRPKAFKICVWREIPRYAAAGVHHHRRGIENDTGCT